VEEMWNELARLHSFSRLCAYLMANFLRAVDGVHFEEVCHRHVHVVPAESFTALDDGEARLREIGRLQQRARALEHELEQRRFLEEALREALAARARTEEQLREAHRAKDELLAMLGHELRNPLAPIVAA